MISCNMAGFRCTLCQQRTFRRPPNNQCEECRPSRRGLNRRWPKVRFKAKKTVAPTGKPESSQSVTVHQAEVPPPPTESVPPPQQSGSAPSSLGPCDYVGFKKGLDTLFEDLAKLFGRANAHNILGCAQAMVNKFESAKREIHADLTTLVAVSISLRGDIHNEGMRRLWYDHRKRQNVNTRKALEARLIMALPFSADLQHEIKLGDITSAL